jgi:hypothetical protein
MVRFATTDTSSWASSASTLPDAGTPYFCAWAAARSGIASAMNRTSTSGNRVRLSRY